MSWKNIAFALSALAFCTLAVGYASARYSLDSCADEVFADAQRRNVSGRHMDGQIVRPSRSDITAIISGPFLVEVWYSVPHDLHATDYSARYVVFFGYRYQRSTETIDSSVDLVPTTVWLIA
jgi:hypothetical protein